MLAVPCGLPSYLGPWPPVAARASLIAPLAELAACTPHSAAAVRDRRRAAGDPVRPSGATSERTAATDP